MPRRPLAAALAAAALLLAAAPAARAGPWVPAPWRGYAKLWARWLYGIGYGDGSGATRDYGSYNEVFVNLYAEVGLPAGLALVVSTPLVRVFLLEDVRTGELRRHVKPGDPALALRWRFWRAGPWVAAVEAGARFPVTSKRPLQPVHADEPGFPRIGTLLAGTGVYDGSLTLSVGRTLGRWYAAAAAGYTVRSGGYAHVVDWSVEGGGSFLDGRVAARARVRGHHPIAATGSAAYTESPSGVGNGTAYTALALEGEYRIHPNLALGLSFEGGIAGVRRQSHGPVTSLYLAATF